MKKIIIFLAFSIVLFKWIPAQELPSFDADLGKKSVLGQDIRIPYTDVISYFGYVKQGSAPDEEIGGKKYYYLYMWIPVASPEIGIRMVSPVPKGLSPDKKDFVMDEYTANADDKKSYFDTWITFQRADNVVTDADIVTNGQTAGWIKYGQNDDSGELPEQPSGNKYNSLLRVTSNPSDPTKALVVGLYRIGFTSFKRGEVQGSFIAQIGAVVNIPGVKIARDLVSLKAAVDAK